MSYHKDKIIEFPVYQLGHYNLQLQDINEEIVTKFYIPTANYNDKSKKNNLIRVKTKLIIEEDGMHLGRGSKVLTGMGHSFYPWSHIKSIFKFKNDDEFVGFAVKDTDKLENNLLLLQFKSKQSHLKCEQCIFERTPQMEHFLIDLPIKSNNNNSQQQKSNGVIAPVNSFHEDAEISQKLNGLSIDKQPFAVGHRINNPIALPDETEIQHKMKMKDQSFPPLQTQSQTQIHEDCEIQTMSLSFQEDNNNEVKATVGDSSSTTRVTKNRVLITYETDDNSSSNNYSRVHSGPSWTEDTKYVNYESGLCYEEEAGPIYMYTRQQMSTSERRYSVCTDGSVDSEEEDDDEKNFSMSSTPARRYGVKNEVVEVKYAPVPPNITRNGRAAVHAPKNVNSQQVKSNSSAPVVYHAPNGTGNSPHYTNLVNSDKGDALY